ncbi:MAG TPA: DUF362 domain-containing protein [Candidatus Brocadiia bacterium]|nr:DUF362 domain-containing protein [Candidatus Brocadiia bacterium]
MAEEKKEKCISRRGFLKKAAIGGGVVVAGGAAVVAYKGRQFIEGGEKGLYIIPDKTPDGAGRVVDVRNAAWLGADNKPDAETIRKMLDSGLMRLTGKDTPEAAWREIVSPDCRIGVKFNKLSHDFARVNQPILDAVVAGLLSAGVKKSNIAAVETEGARLEGGFEPDFEQTGAADFGDGVIRPSRFIRDQVDVLINCSDMKDHGIAGVTAALKNIAFADKTLMNWPFRFHGNHCDPFIPGIFNLKMFREKVRLNICNGLKGIFQGGPGVKPANAWRNDGMLLSTDPVAMDRVALDIIEQERARRKLPAIFTGQPNSKGHYLITAQDVYRLGVADLAKINHEVIAM